MPPELSEIDLLYLQLAFGTGFNIEFELHAGAGKYVGQNLNLSLELICNTDRADTCKDIISRDHYHSRETRGQFHPVLIRRCEI